VKVAVASKEGISISQHFGHAKKFWIYSVHESYCELLETRDVANYCLGHSARPSAMAIILRTINDCEAVFVAKIGDGPTEKLKAIGVTAVDHYAHEAIGESLLDYVQKVSST
jgi:predicted Fe-Mo cluster-binding NifX family protein